MKKQLLVALAFVFTVCSSQAQTDKFWSTHNGGSDKIVTDKGVARLSFPKKFDLYDLNIDPLRQILFSTQGLSKNGVIITLPNADGKLEQFQMVEASNFDATLQAQFPQIRAYSGKGITDKYATLKLSISPQGIQTMVFRTDKENEFIEPYSKDHTVYAVYKSQREKGSLAWTCSTDDKNLALKVTSKVGNVNKSSAGELKVMRLAQSVTAEYSNYFGASTAGTPADQALALGGINATLTRCNGVYEKDLAVHLDLVAASVNAIFYDPATDPYDDGATGAGGSWNAQLQGTLTSVVGEANYDIGHLFGASGGGGNAGCIGCVCVDGQKGSGFTSPADGIPAGDNFDIDYVVHEVGHQMGGNHTFSNSNEGAGVSKEVGSGVTIMGYAGITSQDVAPHSIDIYHEATIAQIQANLATKSCPVTTSLAGNNATPVVAPVGNYIIPITTPFILTGSATDADAGDVLTYCWEQNDDGGNVASTTGANSSAKITKVLGPNFISWPPTASPSRYFPKLASIIANSATTNQVGGDAGMKSEALSSVARVLNFRLTVRDNVPYSSTPPLTAGQTSYTDMKVTVTAAAGPFKVTAPDTAISWPVGTNQTVTWNVAGTTANGVDTPNVDIYLSTDGGLTYPILLASKVPNDGSENITVPNNVGATNRVMVKGNNHIFFDISNANFTIAAPSSGFAIAFDGVAGEQNVDACQGTDVSYTIPYTTYSGFSGTTTFGVTGIPVGSTATFSPTSVTTDGNVILTISNTNAATAGLASMVVTATSGTTSTASLYLNLLNSNFGTQTLNTPADLATGQSTSVTLNWAANAAATSYDVQVATDVAFLSMISSANVTTNSYVVSGLTDLTDYYWRVLPKNSACIGTYSTPYKFTTGATVCSDYPATIIVTTGPSPEGDQSETDNPSTGTYIPDAVGTTYTPVSSTLNIPSGIGNITDLNIALQIHHTWIGDLTATLTSPTGTTITLFAGPCTGDNLTYMNIDATFDDAGVTPVCATSPGGLSGTVLPTSPLSAFNGEDPTGTWTLTVVDKGAVDTGKINAWSLNICSTTLAVAHNTLSNFILYPNPNKGNFTVKFDSKTSSDIAISIHDIAGRMIMNKKYTNTGLISQNVSLENVQTGIYLVTVQDGDNKVVKRIVVE